MTNFLRTNGMAVIGSTVILTTTTSYDRGISVQPFAAGGFPSPANALSFSASPSVSFQTYDLIGLLSVLGLTQNSITSNPTSIWSRVIDNEGISDASWTKYYAAKGSMVITSIAASQGRPVQSSVMLTPSSSDGYTSPVAQTSTTPPTASPISTFLSLGTVSFNGTPLTQATGWTLSLNNSIVGPITDGNYYTQNTGLIGHAPTVSVQFVNPTEVEGIFSDKPIALDGTNGLVLQMNETNAEYIITSNVGKTFTIKQGIAYPNTVPGNQGQIITTGFTVVATSDLSNPVIAIS